jgi:ATP-binding protein involved in chromosome partitioning
MATSDAARAIDMFQLDAIAKPIIGVVENMSFFTPVDAPDKKYRLFGEGGGKALAEKNELPFLGELPFQMELGNAADTGKWDFSQEHMKPYLDVAKEIARQISVMQA